MLSIDNGMRKKHKASEGEKNSKQTKSMRNYSYLEKRKNIIFKGKYKPTVPNKQATSFDTLYSARTVYSPYF